MHMYLGDFNMTFFKATAAAALLSMSAAGVSAATIDTSAYDSSVVVLDDFGFTDFSGANFGNEFVALDDFGLLSVSGVPFSDADAEFLFDQDNDFDFEIDIVGASGSEFLDDSFSLFFENATNGYLFTFISDFGGAFFGSPDTDLFGETGSVSVEVFSRSSVPAVPLPAGLPLILAGLGSFYMVGRRRKSA